MPDFTMCESNQCKLHFKCARSKDSGTRPSDMQSYDDFYHSDDKLKCDMFKEKE